MTAKQRNELVRKLSKPNFEEIKRHDEELGMCAEREAVMFESLGHFWREMQELGYDVRPSIDAFYNVRKEVGL